MPTMSEGYPRCPFDPEGDPALHTDHFSAFDEFRELGNFFSTSIDGFWVLTTYEAQRDAMRDSDTFSTRLTGATRRRPIGELLIPVQLDPPEHTKYRHILTPLLSPTAIQRIEPAIRSACTRLLDAVGHGDEVDGIAAYARPLPTAVFLGLLGVDENRADTFVEWAETVVHPDSLADPEGVELARAISQIREMLASEIESRKSRPSDDFLSALVKAHVDERPLTDDELLNMAFMLYLAGLHTVVGQLGYTLLHFATHDGDRARIVKDPSSIPDAVEELLRRYSGAAPSRVVTRDVEFHGCPMKEGDKVWLPLYMACQDPTVFDDAGTVVMGRRPNRHLAFGAGVHNCVGVHLARRELQIATELWHERFPNYRLADGADLVESLGSTATLHSLPLQLERARIGA